MLSGRFHGKERMSRERIGKEYGMAGRNVTRYIQCERLIRGFKEMLDEGELTMAAGVELSFLPEEEQEIVLDVAERNGIQVSREKTREIRSAAGSITAETALRLLGVDKPVREAARPVRVTLPPQVYSRYFGNVAADDVRGILEKALEHYFDRKGA